ncbi:NAD(P)H-dependent oxidoreductase [Bizionia saleffrena]|uniref:NAD(P)H-dependent oxidoreductase n=1 Tax=Bizionia saleffrena TaxID=291189 RepID=A0A8H2LE53_9FLAO|nr:NADPH-dependent FMN reductase [Bizionia saleffrena]TYB73088.1 NAD(P)H-dependent oxidoreductase [Bizionia saleffrena]
MKKIIAFAGSTSQQSINKQLVEYTCSLIEKETTEVLDLNDYKMPLFGVDKEVKEWFPENAKRLLEKIKTADGLVISLAEHNGAYSAAFKNAFDWMSRIESKTFFNKPMLLMATSPGSRGGSSVLAMAKERFPLHNATITETFSLPFFNDNFSEDKIINEALNTELKKAVATFKSAL